MKKIIFLCILVISQNVSSQEIRKVSKTKENKQLHEVYYALKNDKSIKQGNYVRYLKFTPYYKLFFEYGSYDNDKRTGAWLMFNVSHPQNPIRIVGEFSDGYKSGQWVYFHTPEISDHTYIPFQRYKKLSNIVEPKGKNKEFKITVDTTGIRVSTIGNFLNNKKVGKWRYYSRNGQLLKEFDFTTEKETYNSHDTSYVNILEGLNHFREQLDQILIEDAELIRTFNSTITKFEIVTVNSTVFVNNLTNILNDPFSLLLEKRIKSMPLDWIDYDKDLENFSFFIETNVQPTDEIRPYKIIPKFAPFENTNN